MAVTKAVTVKGLLCMLQSVTFLEKPYVFKQQQVNNKQLA